MSKTTDCLEPRPALLAKLGSIAVHVKEGMGKTGHAFDVEAAMALVNDPEVEKWLREMDALAMLPKVR